VGTIGDLDQARQRRAERIRAAAEHATLHPALRWAAGDDGAAHRRTRDGRTVCGEPGPLVLADAGTELCPACYPSRTGT
jgi:hypothetical protein